jgi:MFS family permease
LVAPAAGKLSDRIGPRPLLLAGMLLQGLGLSWLAVAATTGAGYGALVLPLVVAGIGISLAFPAAPAAAIGAVAPSDTGKASGANSTMQRFGGAFGVAIATAVFTANGHLGTAASFAAGFRPALATVAALSALGAVVSLGVRRRRTVPAPAAAQSLPAGARG